MPNLKVAPEFTFENLTFTVSNRKGKKDILNNISGRFPSGKLIAILGPSGAGKTTLLNVLSGWDTHSKISGSVKLNGKDRDVKDFKSISTYITQESHLTASLTVRENLKYAADFKLGLSVSKSTKAAIIQHTVESFGLTEHMETKTSRLSGGQRKRLAICLELLNDPDIIFLDEPTTGLDIVSMSQCVRYLKNLTEHGNTVICTLHQPPGNVAKMFDVVYIVAQGQCAYQGGTEELVTFLSHSGVPCEIFHSPLDYIIEIANNDYGPKALETLMETSQNGQNMAYMPPLNTTDVQAEDTVARKTRNIFTRWGDYSFKEDLFQLRTMMRREIVKLRRDVCLTYLRFFAVIAMSCMTSLVCYNLGGNAIMLYFNYNLVLLYIAILALSFATFTTVGFVLHQKVTRNEYENGYYSIRNYFLTTTVLDIPVTLLSVTLSTILLYWLSGQLMTVHRISMFLILSIEVAMVAGAMGFLFGSIFNLNQAIFISSAIHIPILAISGYGISMTDMPRHFYYLSHLAYTRFAVRSMMGVVFGYDHPPSYCPEEVVYCHYERSILFLNEMGLEDYYFVYDATALAGFYVFFRFLAYCAIRYRMKTGIYVE